MHTHTHIYIHTHTYIHTRTHTYTGADPGFRRGGGFVHSEGGGGVRTGISGADPNCCRVLGKSTSKKELQTAVGGVSDHPKIPPVSAHDTCMYTCMHTYIYTCIHTYIHTYTHTYIPVHTYMHTYIHTYTHTYIHTYRYIHTCMYACYMFIHHLNQVFCLP